MRAFNTLMQSFYHNKVDEFEDKNDWDIMMLRVFSDFLLAIRKDLYSTKTKLKRSQLVEFMITDIKDYKDRVDK